MKKLAGVTLGILTAIGGFVDIGDLVANTETGARFRMSLAWVVVVGVIGIVVYAEMAGRVATISKRPVFDLVRERLGARMALVNLGASFFINFLTVTAEIAGVAVVLQLISNINYLVWIPLVVIALVVGVPIMALLSMNDTRTADGAYVNGLVGQYLSLWSLLSYGAGFFYAWLGIRVLDRTRQKS